MSEKIPAFVTKMFIQLLALHVSSEKKIAWTLGVVVCECIYKIQEHMETEYSKEVN